MFTPQERKEVLKALLALAEIYGKNLSESSLVFMAEALADVPFENLIRAMRDYTRDPQARGFPYPGQLRALAVPKMTLEDDAREVASRIMRAVTNYGWNNPQRAKLFIGDLGWAVVEKEGGWQQVCQNTRPEQHHILKAQWRELAIATAKRAELGQLDPRPELPKPPEAIQGLITASLKKLP